MDMDIIDSHLLLSINCFDMLKIFLNPTLESTVSYIMFETNQYSFLDFALYCTILIS